MECAKCPFGPKCEMRREVIPDLRGVYYRGRFWAATAWSRVGKGLGAEDASKVEPDGICKAEMHKRSRESRQAMRPVA